MIRTVAHFSPARVIVLFTCFTILMGTLLLALPIARHAPLSFTDLFFTATSSTCVTGMFTISLSQFTVFGHWVILALMQIGGLGLITLTLFILYLLFDLGFGAQLLAGHIFEIESWKEVKHVLFFIVIITFLCELIGTAFTFACIKDYYPLPKALFLSLFHAVSCFCNAGITLFEHDLFFQLFTANYFLLVISALLMFAGSFGFLTWIDIFGKGKAYFESKRYTLSLATKIVCMGTLLLIIIPAAILFVIEYNNAFAHLSFFGKIMHALYNAISLRSTGLLSVPLMHWHMASFVLIMIVAFIGAAPGSTGSGIKVSTFIIICTIIKTAIRGQTQVNIKGRQIAKDQLLKAVTITILSGFWIVGTIFSLLILQTNINFLGITLEAVSATTNLGLTTGITPSLAISSKYLLIVSMIIGRIGSLTLVLALLKSHASTDRITFPQERILLS